MSDSRAKGRSLYFSDTATIARFEDWCRDRGMAVGKAIQCMLAAYIDDLELQKHQMEITLPTREVKFA